MQCRHKGGRWWGDSRAEREKSEEITIFVCNLEHAGVSRFGNARNVGISIYIYIFTMVNCGQLLSDHVESRLCTSMYCIVSKLYYCQCYYVWPCWLVMWCLGTTQATIHTENRQHELKPLILESFLIFFEAGEIHLWNLTLIRFNSPHSIGGTSSKAACLVPKLNFLIRLHVEILWPLTIYIYIYKVQWIHVCFYDPQKEQWQNAICHGPSRMRYAIREIQRGRNQFRPRTGKWWEVVREAHGGSSCSRVAIYLSTWGQYGFQIFCCNAEILN